MNDQEAVAQDTEASDVSTRSVAEHLNSLLLSADSAAQRIVREAETRAQEQLAEVDVRIRRMEAEAAKLASWKQETDHMIQGLADAIGAFSGDVAEIPGRIDEALGPLASHVPHVVRQIDELRNALGMPSAEGRPEVVPVVHVEAEAPSQDGPVLGELQVGWLPSWEDLEDGTR